MQPHTHGHMRTEPPECCHMHVVACTESLRVSHPHTRTLSLSRAHTHTHTLSRSLTLTCTRAQQSGTCTTAVCLPYVCHTLCTSASCPCCTHRTSAHHVPRSHETEPDSALALPQHWPGLSTDAYCSTDWLLCHDVGLHALNVCPWLRSIAGLSALYPCAQPPPARRPLSLPNRPDDINMHGDPCWHLHPAARCLLR